MNEYEPDVVSNPGDSLWECIMLELTEDRGLHDMVSESGLTLQTILGVVLGEIRIDEEIAVGLETMLGIPASFWIARDKAYRDWIDRKGILDNYRK